MLELLWLIPALPLASFVLLALLGGRMPRRGIAWVGVGSIGLAFAVALVIASVFMGGTQPSASVILWTWMSISGFVPRVALYLDGLSLVMVLVITGVGFLIHLYSAEYMADEEGYRRFFAYMNLFVGAMLLLVLASDLLVLLVGWEGVGLCSFLLIGFWYRDPANGRAARKAFIVTRVGDTALLLGIFLLLGALGTLDIQQVLQRAAIAWPVGSPPAVWATALILGGALGKSAQLPLQTWLPDAMAGPTPVSALIHAATMVTAGVYLIARTNRLFALAPNVMLVVAIIGALTLLYAAISALAQTDIKRALAYSTMSQIGYMFLALGVGAWSAAMFHFMTHAFFKALLFLGAGVAIAASHHKQNMFEMGGLRDRIPLTFWTFVIGAASLSAVPLVTAGFYSKDAILLAAWESSPVGPLLWLAGTVGAFLTGLYAFRIVFLTFYGATRDRGPHRTGVAVTLPLVVLAALAVLGGFGGSPVVSPGAAPAGAGSIEGTLQLISSLAALGGIAVAYVLYGRRKPQRAAADTSQAGRFFLSGWGVDALYEQVFVRPYSWLTHVARADVLDVPYRWLAAFTVDLHQGLASTQSGKLRWYAFGIAAGAVAAVALGVWPWR